MGGSGANADDIVRQITDFLGKNKLGAGAALGGLGALILGTRTGRSIAVNAAKLGALAVVGGLAYKAYNDWQATKGGNSTVSQGEAADAAANLKNITPKAEGTPFLPAPQAQRNALGIKLLQAMIAAAKADGHISAEERQRISQQLAAMGVGPDGRSFIAAELAAPLDIGAIANCATGPEQAAEIYAASLLAIDRAGAAERGYLAMLAARLGLEPGLVEHLHANADALIALQPA